MASAELAENQCGCADNKPIKDYCSRCKRYICTDCRLANHADHEAEIVDLAEKCTRFLAEYQRLARTASLMAERRQVHIKDESIDGILSELKAKILKAKEALTNDINKATSQDVAYIDSSPIILEFKRRKKELEDNGVDPLYRVKNELGTICKDLLIQISESKFESADRVTAPERLKEYEETIKRLSDASGGDLDFIQEIRKLKKTRVEYSYDPTAILGMIRLDAQLKRPPRVVQFDREKNLLNLYRLDTARLSCTHVSAGFILPFRFIALVASHGIYLTGGDNDHGRHLKSVFAFDELRGALVPMPDMHEPRSRHALVNVEDRTRFYALGGEGGDGVKAACEFFDIAENKWVLVPDLNEPRCGHSACLVGNCIFVIGGWHKECILAVEKLDLTDGKKWDALSLGKKCPLKAVQLPGLAEVKDHTLLIFGGYREEEQVSRDCFLLDTRTLALKAIQQLTEPDAFVASEARRHDTHIYSFGYEKGGIHTYDIEHDLWTFVPQKDLPK